MVCNAKMQHVETILHETESKGINHHSYLLQILSVLQNRGRNVEFVRVIFTYFHPQLSNY